MDLKNREFTFVICLILVARVIRGKRYDCSQSIRLFLPIFSLLFHLRVKGSHISFLDLLERNSIRPFAFPAGFPGVEPLGLHDLFIDSLLVQLLPTEKP